MNRTCVFAASITKTCLRRLSTTKVRCRKPDLTHIRKRQELFQQDNGIPIHLKGGSGDYVLFYTTVALTLIGMGSAMHSTYKLAFSKMSTTDEPCSPKGEPCPEPPKPKDPCPPKMECSAPPPPPPPVSTCREPPPCPPMPPCPPTVCPPVPDPNNPCNYCPPPCRNPEYPDLTKLKKLQCKFQQDNGIPVYLKGGKFDVFLYQLTLLLTIVGLLTGMYTSIDLVLK